MNYRHFVSPATQTHLLEEPFTVESGATLSGVEVAYRTWGELNLAGDNAVLICHALTGWADADVWWEPLIGPGKALDPKTDFIVCSNVLGSCYGTTGPTSRPPETARPYRAAFPAITIRDMVNLQEVLMRSLSIRRWKLVIGGSLGGMQVLEWALLHPEKVEAIAAFATSGRHSAWCIGLGEAQRQAIYADPNWQEGFYRPEDPPMRGLAVARMMAMNTYRSWHSYEQRFGREVKVDRPEQPFSVETYLQYQGQKLVDRFDANTYVTLTKAMDAHDVARNRGDYREVLRSLQQPALVVAIDSDVLYPPVEQEELAALMPNARLEWLRSPHGHDAFLINMDELNDMVMRFREKRSVPAARDFVTGTEPVMMGWRSPWLF